VTVYYPDKMKQPETEPPVDDAVGASAGPEAPTPKPASLPEMPHPSATVQPFDSAGVPHPSLTPSTPKHHKVLRVLAVLAVLVVAAAGYMFYAQFKPVRNAAKTTTPTPRPVNIADDYSGFITSLGDVDTSLTNADTSLGDKAGDLSE
jgi:hypothetical protein